MLNKKEKENLKKARKKITFISIKSSVLFTMHSAAITFFLTLLFQSENNSPLFIDLIISFILSTIIYFISAKYAFKNISLCLKLTSAYFKIQKKKR